MSDELADHSAESVGKRDLKMEFFLTKVLFQRDDLGALPLPARGLP